MGGDSSDHTNIQYTVNPLHHDLMNNVDIAVVPKIEEETNNTDNNSSSKSPSPQKKRVRSSPVVAKGGFSYAEWAKRTKQIMAASAKQVWELSSSKNKNKRSAPSDSDSNESQSTALVPVGNSEGLSRKRARTKLLTIKEACEKRAEVILSQKNKKFEKYDARELLEVLSIDSAEGKDELMDLLCKVKPALENSCWGRNEARDRQERAKRVLRILGTCSKDEKRKKFETFPEAPNTVAAEEEMTSEFTSKQRRLELICMSVDKYVDALAKVEMAEATDARMEEDLISNFQRLQDESVLLLEEAEQAVLERFKAYEDSKEKRAELDKKISEAATTEAGDGHSVSTLLDMLQSGNMATKNLLESREKRSLAERKAKEEVDHAENVKRFMEICKELSTMCENIAKLDASASRERVKAYRGNIKRDSHKGVSRLLPYLCSALYHYSDWFQERRSKASKKLKLKRKELREHERLWGDEAPSEKKELTSKIAEYTKLLERTDKMRSEMLSNHLAKWGNWFSRGVLPPTILLEVQNIFEELLKESHGLLGLGQLCDAVIVGSYKARKEAIVRENEKLQKILAAKKEAEAKEEEEKFVLANSDTASSSSAATTNEKSKSPDWDSLNENSGEGQDKSTALVTSSKATHVTVVRGGQQKGKNCVIC